MRCCIKTSNCSIPLKCPLLLFLTGLRGTEMWRGGFYSGYELFGQIFISGSNQENETAAAGSHMHVSGIQDEGDGSPNGRETLYLHRQLCASWRTPGNGLFCRHHGCCVTHVLAAEQERRTKEHRTRIQSTMAAAAPVALVLISVSVMAVILSYWLCCNDRSIIELSW